MELIGIDHEFCWDAEVLESLVHLLSSDDRKIEIIFPSEEHGRRLDPVGF